MVKVHFCQSCPQYYFGVTADNIPVLGTVDAVLSDISFAVQCCRSGLHEKTRFNSIWNL